MTVSGKPLKEHLEALDHYDAICYVRELARHETPVTESDVRNLHKLVMQRSAPNMAGQSVDLPRFDAPRRLAAIHPFNDGNGRTVWLLMNLVLIRASLPATGRNHDEVAQPVSFGT